MIIHVGQIIRDYLKVNNISINDFALIIYRSRAAAYKILSSDSVSTELLYRISIAYKHDFFFDISCLLDQSKVRLNN